MSSGGHRDLSNLMDISKLLSEESNNNDGLEKELESSTVLTVKAEITPQVRDLTLYIMEYIHQAFFKHFRKNSSPKKLNGPKNSTIFQA